MSELLQEKFLSQLQQLEKTGAATFFADISPNIPIRQISILLDCGLSMESILDEAQQSIAALAWLALRKNIIIRFIPFNDSPVLNIPLFMKESDYRRFVHAIESVKLKGQGNPYKAVVESKSNPQNLTVLASDMLGPNNIELFEVLSRQGGKSILLHTFEPSLFIPPNKVFTGEKDLCYDSSTTVIEIKKFLEAIDAMCKAMTMPSFRITKKSGWLHLAHYLFNWMGYRRVG